MFTQNQEIENEKSLYTCTFNGWLIVLHKISVPGPAFTLIFILSFLAIFFPAGVTNSGKLYGIVKVYWPSWYNSFCDHLTLIVRLEPPSICEKTYNNGIMELWKRRYRELKHKPWTKTTFERYLRYCKSENVGLYKVSIFKFRFFVHVLVIQSNHLGRIWFSWYLHLNT